MNLISCDDSIKYLKNKINLISTKNDIKVSFIKNKVFIQSSNSSFYLNEYEFKELYKDTFFIIDESNEDSEEISLDKDKEYYSISRLKK